MGFPVTGDDLLLFILTYMRTIVSRNLEELVSSRDTIVIKVTRRFTRRADFQFMRGAGPTDDTTIDIRRDALGLVEEDGKDFARILRMKTFHAKRIIRNAAFNIGTLGAKLKVPILNLPQISAVIGVHLLG